MDSYFMKRKNKKVKLVLFNNYGRISVYFYLPSTINAKLDVRIKFFDFFFLKSGL